MARKSLGFGDDVEKAISLARLDRIAKLVTKRSGCSGCTRRKNNLNRPELLINKIFYPQQKIETNEQND